MKACCFCGNELPANSDSDYHGSCGRVWDRRVYNRKCAACGEVKPAGKDPYPMHCMGCNRPNAFRGYPGGE